MQLSVIISERNDPVATLITARNILEEFKALGPKFAGEIVIADNSDNPMKRKILQDIIPYRYIKSKQIKLVFQNFQCLFSARELAIINSSGKYLLIIDSHCLMYYEAVKNFFEFAESTKNLGIVFGPMCYSKAHEVDAFWGRDVKNFSAIRGCNYNISEPFKISVRGMPWLVSRKLWDEMRGYSPLSDHKLCWGGGDFIISFKPLLLGYDNWLLPSAGAIHLGPFNDQGQFAGSFLNSSSNSFHRYVGMMTAAYVIGGEELLNFRFEQFTKRTPNLDIKRMKSLALSFGSNDRRWMEEKSKLTYTEIAEKFKNPAKVNKRKYSLGNILPSSEDFKTKDVYGYNLQKQTLPDLSSPPLVKGSDWKARIVNSKRSLKNLTNLEARK